MQEKLSNLKKEKFVIVRGGGDLATGTIMRLYQCGFHVLILETDYPSAIRRNVAFSEAVYQGEQTVEDVTAYLVKDTEEAVDLLIEKKLPILVDPKGQAISVLKPGIVVDAILAKKNLGTKIDMAPVTVGLGPGFEAKVDVDAVIETKRGHRLGRVLYEGCAAANTGIPGIIAGYGKERVIHSPAKGIFRQLHAITDLVEKDEVIANIETEEGNVPVYASLTGLLRGMIRDGYPVTKGFKIADIDPRKEEYDNCFTISDKARSIGGGVLEAILHLQVEKQESL